MQEYSEQFATKEELFKNVDKILQENGTYRIDYAEECATLYYSYPEPERLYTVLKGDDKDCLIFHIPTRGGNIPVHLDKGDTLIFESDEEDDGKVWFSYPKRLIGREAEDMEDAIGYTEFSSLLEMDACGWIGNYNSTDPSEPVQMAPCKTKDKTVIKKTVPRIRTSKQEPVAEDGIYEPGEGSIKRAKKLFGKMKLALGDITNVSQYMSNYDDRCIRTLKISEVHYHTSHQNYYSASYIRLSGRWLEKIGFQVGNNIQIVAINDMLVIVPVKPPSYDF